MRSTSRVSFAGHLFAYPRRTLPLMVTRRTGAVFVMGTSARDRMHTRLYQLKRRLLRSALATAPQPEKLKSFCRAADQAAELAWKTDSPLLVFPCLFEELLIKAQRSRVVPPPVLQTATSVDPVLVPARVLVAAS
ncbi:MAG TPA: hypothetical protein PKN95_08800 [Verrucomicrobiota bacterium]|nr:hypothetical protein [Verrucomicrobiota bacterium]HNT15734.1 hypothetical protein [Verrucomicrobiota bacterium]